MKHSKTITRLRSMREAMGRTGEGEDGESPPEAGFTLIELMVVLLIMGILLAIAIPTFLGVTGSAHAAAAKTNLSSAMTEAQASYTSNSSYTVTATEVKALTAETKAMTFTATKSTKTSVISVDVSTTGQAIVLATYQKSTNVCWMEVTNESGATTSASNPPDAPSGTSYYGFKPTGTATDPTTCVATHKVADATWAKTYPKVS